MRTNMWMIYKFTSPSGRSYIGQTNNFNRRKRQHQLTTGSRAFHNAIKKYGFETFQLEILAENLTSDEANELEVKYIMEYDTLAPSGYNLTTGGLNQQPSDETKRRLSEAKIGKPRQPFTAEHKQKISMALSDKPRSSETRKKIASSKLGKPQPKQRIICPHCNTEGGNNVMKRWHFDNCRYRETDGLT